VEVEGGKGKEKWDQLAYSLLRGKKKKKEKKMKRGRKKEEKEKGREGPLELGSLTHFIKEESSMLETGEGRERKEKREGGGRKKRKEKEAHGLTVILCPILYVFGGKRKRTGKKKKKKRGKRRSHDLSHTTRGVLPLSLLPFLPCKTLMLTTLRRQRDGGRRGGGEKKEGRKGGTVELNRLNLCPLVFPKKEPCV